MERRSTNAKPELRGGSRSTGGKISGYASVFYKRSDAGTEYTLAKGVVERVTPTAFNRAVMEDDVVALWNHNADKPLARTSSGTLSLTVDGRGLFYECEPANTALYREVSEYIKRGDVNASSFAFGVIRDNWKTEGNQDVRELVECKLFDVSPVSYPAYPATTTGMRSAGRPSEMRGEEVGNVFRTSANQHIARLGALLSNESAHSAELAKHIEKSLEVCLRAGLRLGHITKDIEHDAREMQLRWIERRCVRDVC